MTNVTSVRALVGDSVYEAASVTVFDGWLRIDFDAEDLDSIQIRVEDLPQFSTSPTPADGLEPNTTPQPESSTAR